MEASFRAATPDLVISTTAQLKAFADSVNNGNTYENKLVRLGADIRFDGTTVNNFTPINFFEGTFDGAGHTISGVIIVENDDRSIGLFRSLGYGGVIKNLTVSNIEITTNYSEDVGGIAGYNNGGIYNCSVINSKLNRNDNRDDYYDEYHDDDYYYFVGGIVGDNVGTLDACRNINTSVYNRTGGTGGIAGESDGNILNCINTGSVVSKDDCAEDRHMTGGICGFATDDIINCGNTGSVTGYNPGGIIGYCKNATLQNCYNAGSVSSYYNKDYEGGVAKKTRSDTVISNCFYVNSAVKSIADCGNSTITRNVSSMAVADMKKAAFVNRLNTNGSANADWIPWELRSGLVYPQHKTVYSVEVADISYGTMNVSTPYAYQGKTVTFQVTPDTYYRVSSVSVKTSGGTAVACNGANGTYSFVMPASGVTIAIGFSYSKPIAQCNITLSSTSYTYNGTEKRPDVTVKDGMKNLVAGKDYTYKYSSNINAGTGIVTFSGMGTYSGTATVGFTIYKASQSLNCNSTYYTKVYGNKGFSLGAKTKAGPKNITYKSSSKSVATVNASGKVSIKGIGSTTITITATGNTNYQTETKYVYITVKPKQQTVTKLRSKNGRKLQISWKKDKKASGYLIQYTRDKYYWNNYYVYNNSTTSITLNYLVNNAKYYVRVCSYKDVGGSRYYGDYSPTAKSAKIQERVTPQIENCSITLSNTSYTYNGKEKKPSVTVKYGSTTLSQGTDYTLSYSSNKNVGTGKVKITGIGIYSGSITKTFRIEKGTQKISYTKKYKKTYGAKAFKLNVKRTRGNGKLTYKSSNRKVVTVSKSGKVTLRGSGKAVITVTAKGTSKYNAKSVKITVQVKKGAQKITCKKSYKKTYGAKAFNLNVKRTKGNGKITYKSSNRKVATVNAKGNVTIKGSGKTVITVTAKGTSKYNVKSVKITIQVKKASQNISYTKKFKKTYGDGAFKLEAKRIKGNGKLTYKSSNKKIATVNSKGKVVIKGCGRVTITVTAKSTSQYKAKSVQVVITVKPLKSVVKSVKALSKKKMSVSWKKDAKCTGYEIQYSTDKKFKKNIKVKNISKNGTTQIKLQNLKKGNVYYVRVRAYKTIKVNGKEQKLYGKYSAIKESPKIHK